MKRTLAGRAADTWVLASREKIGAASPFTVLPLSAVSGIVTDAPADSAVLLELQRTGSTIVSAS
jgi:DeoR/GlpR family transcriptional regulator of sugar metabolism